jgi:hypothetical protein
VILVGYVVCEDHPPTGELPRAANRLLCAYTVPTQYKKIAGWWARSPSAQDSNLFDLPICVAQQSEFVPVELFLQAEVLCGADSVVGT